MIGVVLVAHAHLASEMKASVEYILQKQPLFHAVDVLNSDEIDVNKKAFQTVLENMVSSCDSILVMVDIFGATPCNMTMNVIADFEASVTIELVAGFNLPSVLKAMMEREHAPLETLASLVLDAGQKYMRLGSKERVVSRVFHQDKAA